MPPHAAAAVSQWNAHASPFALQTLASDDYDDDADLVDLLSVPGPSSSSSSNPNDRVVRRRSSKACDQCRKSKCKCERGSLSEPCKACIMLGTQCTFLGPSRKRGPPKGYIDAIEARLHQTEALVGILLAANDVRAKSLLDDLAEDPLANEIIRRVDHSPYGVKGRARAESGGQGAGAGIGIGAGSGAGSSKPESKTKAFLEQDTALPPTHPKHPSNEWQDAVASRLSALARKRGQTIPGRDLEAAQNGRPTLSLVTTPTTHGTASTSTATSTAAAAAAATATANNDDNGPRQRRRVETSPRSSSTLSSPRASTHADALDSDEDQALVSEVGQLSLNEERELRFHGKASGLHLLGVKDRVDGRNEGGIWRFPKARVWPPLPHRQLQVGDEDEEVGVRVALPDAAGQEALLELYFTYVHPSLPVVHKQAFLEAFRLGNIGTPPPHEASPADSPGGVGSSGGTSKPRAFVSRLLLLVMFSIAARFASHRATALSPTDGSMWPAGDEYYDAARAILGRTYAAPRAATCQALLLMGYREVGIGAMAQAWLFVGMAIRMAHDLGLHKSADKWGRMGGGRGLFAPVELQERRRIWAACVLMDKYVSAYIGRPVYIHECDFDTALPSETEPEELEDWRSKPSTVIVYDPDDHEGAPLPIITVPGRVISCFNAATTLATITGRIVHSIYAIRAGPGRHAEMLRLEQALDKWFLDLPEHLRLDPSAAAGASPPPLPPPHVLTMHAGYWAVVILLHRPFIRYVLDGKAKGREDAQLRAISQRNYDLCVQAANHITSIVALYEERYCLRRGPVFLSYYVFTAGIMHVISLTAYPDDPQARRGLTMCMHVLHLLDTVWPSAQRAWELLNGSKVNQVDGPAFDASPPVAAARAAAAVVQKERLLHKRSAETFLADDARFYSAASVPAGTSGAGTGAGAGARMPFAQPATSSLYASPPSYERWGSSDAAPFSDSLSTSGLPQQYSTGFIERLPPLAGSHTPSAGAGAGTGASSTNGASARYPQYWNDYATLNPLEVPYGSHERQPHPHPHPHSHPSQHQQGHGIFAMQEPPYHMYGSSAQ